MSSGTTRQQYISPMEEDYVAYNIEEVTTINTADTQAD